MGRLRVKAAYRGKISKPEFKIALVMGKVIRASSISPVINIFPGLRGGLDGRRRHGLNVSKIRIWQVKSPKITRPSGVSVNPDGLR